MKDNLGKKYSSTQELQDLLKQYFSTVYQCNDKEDIDVEMEAFFQDLELQKLTKTQSEEMDRPLTIEEFTNALFDMRNNETPGPDGFPAEFYKAFWEKLKHIFNAMVQESLSQGFDVNFLRCIMTLLGKKERDLLLIDSWRPISLLNC